MINYLNLHWTYAVRDRKLLLKGENVKIFFGDVKDFLSECTSQFMEDEDALAAFQAAVSGDVMVIPKEMSKDDRIIQAVAEAIRTSSNS